MFEIISFMLTFKEPEALKVHKQFQTLLDFMK